MNPGKSRFKAVLPTLSPEGACEQRWCRRTKGPLSKTTNSVAIAYIKVSLVIMWNASSYAVLNSCGVDSFCMRLDTKLVMPGLSEAIMNMHLQRTGHCTVC